MYRSAVLCAPSYIYWGSSSWLISAGEGKGSAWDNTLQQFRQIHFSIWTNDTGNLEKHIFWFWWIQFVIWTDGRKYKYIYIYIFCMYWGSCSSSSLITAGDGERELKYFYLKTFLSFIFPAYSCWTRSNGDICMNVGTLRYMAIGPIFGMCTQTSCLILWNKCKRTNTGNRQTRQKNSSRFPRQRAFNCQQIQPDRLETYYPLGILRQIYIVKDH